MSRASVLTRYIVNGNMESDVTGPTINCKDDDSLLIQATWDNTGSPTGAFYIEGRQESGLHAWVRVPLDRVMGSGFAAVSAGDLDITVNAAGTFAVILTPLFDEMRLFYDAAGGAANTSLQVSITRRKVQ